MNFCNFREKIEFLRDKKVYVGFSGGADSLALLLILHHFAEECNYKLIAIHCEHGIRGDESLRDMEFCRNFCVERRIELQIYQLEVPEKKLPSESIESCARRLRHEVFEKIAFLNGATETFVALGHHRDDAMENLFLRIFRGGNSSSLVNLKEFSQLKNVIYFRPLLPFSKLEIIDFLRQNGVQKFCSDFTNDDNSYLRNFVRNEVISKLKAAFPESYEGIYRSYQALSDDAAYLEKLAMTEFEKIKNCDSIESDFYRGVDKSLLIRILRYYLSCRVGEEFIPNHAWIKKFIDILNSGDNAPKKIELTSKFFYQCQHDKWFVTKVDTIEENELLWDIEQEKVVEFNRQKIIAELIDKLPDEVELKTVSLNECYMDLDLIGEKVLLSHRRAGDSIVRFGALLPSKVKKLIIDKKLNDIEKQKLIFFRTLDNEIFFISGLVHGKIGEISKKSRKIIKIRVEKI